MHSAFFKSFAAVLAAALLSGSYVAAAAAPEKTVRDYSDGVHFATEGGIPDGPCFFVTGRLIAPDFFAGLKRVEDAQGTKFRRGPAIVTQFPRALLLQLSIQDKLCAPPRNPDARIYLTREEMSAMRWAFSWKRAFQLRPAAGITKRNSSVEPLVPYAKEFADTLPKRFVWSYEFVVPSGGVPLTDHLVIVLRQPDGSVIARVAARL